MNKTLKYFLVSTTTLLSTAALISCSLFDSKTRVVIRLQGNNPIMQKLVTNFNNKQSKYKAELSISSGYPGVKKDNNAEFATGKQPNLTIGYPDHFEEYNSLGDRVINLEKYINDPEIGLTPQQLADFKEGFLAEGRTYSKPGTYSLPFTKSVEATYYNEKFFTKHGLTINENPSWDELITLGIQIKEFKKQDLKEQQKTDVEIEKYMKTFYPIGYDSDANLLIRSIVANGGKYTEFDKATNTGKITFIDETNTSEFDITKKVVSYFAKLNKDLILNTKKGNSNQYISNTFKLGNNMISVGSTGGTRHLEFKDVTIGSVAVKLAPEFKKDGVKNVSISQGPSIGILKNADEERNKGAWLFLKEIYTQEFQFENNVKSGYASVLKSIKDYPKYKEWLAAESTSNIQDVFKQVAKLYDRIPESELYLSPVFNKSSKARDLAETIIHGVFSNEEYKAIASTELESKKSEVDAIIKKVINEQYNKIFA